MYSLNINRCLKQCSWCRDMNWKFLQRFHTAYEWQALRGLILVCMAKNLSFFADSKHILSGMGWAYFLCTFSKGKEIEFINTLEAQNKRHEIMSKHQVSEARLQDIQVGFTLQSVLHIQGSIKWISCCSGVWLVSYIPLFSNNIQLNLTLHLCNQCRTHAHSVIIYFHLVCYSFVFLSIVRISLFMPL